MTDRWPEDTEDKMYLSWEYAAESLERLIEEAQEQLVRINERSGYSLKERLRLLTQMGNTEAVSEILAGMRSSSESEVQKLGRKLSARYAS